MGGRRGDVGAAHLVALRGGDPGGGGAASPPDLLLDGAGDGPSLTRPLTVAPGIPAGTLHVSVQAAACDAESENPACHLFQQDWGVPLLLDDTGPDHLVLHLRGT